MTDPVSRAEPLAVAVVLVLPLAVVGVTDRLDPFVGGEVGQIASAVAWVTLVGHLIRRSGRPAADFGLGRPDWLTDGCTALLLVAGLWWLGGWATDLCERFGLPASRTPVVGPTCGWHWGLLAVGLTASAFAEELLYRGYLQTHLRRITGSGVAAWVTTACLFGAAHSYHGPVGPVVCGLDGLLFGAVVWRTGRLWGATAGHAGFNLLNYYRHSQAHP